MPYSEFFKLIRPRTLTAAFSPVILGFAFAYYKYPLYGKLSDTIFNYILLLIAVISAQAAANIWNEYFDFKSGLDLTQLVGNSGSIVRQNISPTVIKKLGLYTITLTFISGLLLAFKVSLWLIPVGITCILIAYFYSAGPRPISRTPFGELASGFSMGFVIVLMSCFIWSHDLYLSMLIPALSSMILIGVILQTNSTRDLDNDRAHGRKTLAILIGRTNSIRLMQFWYIAVQIWLLIWIICDVIPVTTLIALLAIIPAAKAIKTFKTYSDAKSTDIAMRYAAMSTTFYHILFAIGLFIAKN